MRKRYHVEFSFTSMFFWGVGLFILLAWIFVLGIFVGRGFLPKGVKALTELKTQIAKLQDMVSRKDSTELDQTKKFGKDPEFAFYKELSRKSEEKVEKSPSDPKKVGGQIKPEKNINKTNKPSEASGQYTLQIASLDNELKAANLAERLNNRGHPAYHYKVNIKGKTYYRVRCGIFNDKKEANDFQRLIAKQEMIKGFITKIEK